MPIRLSQITLSDSDRCILPIKFRGGVAEVLYLSVKWVCAL
jgi:hypothetical protein